MVFGTVDNAVYLYGLYRDDHIRMWSGKTGQCIAILNCVPNSLETRTRGCKHIASSLNKDLALSTFSLSRLKCHCILIHFNFILTLFLLARSNLLRKAASDLLCVFLENAKGSEFVTIRVVNDGTSVSLQHINVIPSPEFDLVEFDVTPKRIWGLWCNSQGEYNVSSYSLDASGGYKWSSAGLECLAERKIEPGSDPRHAFCSYIFYPGRFQRDVIDRALVVSLFITKFPKKLFN